MFVLHNPHVHSYRYTVRTKVQGVSDIANYNVYCMGTNFGVLLLLTFVDFVVHHKPLKFCEFPYVVKVKFC